MCLGCNSLLTISIFYLAFCLKWLSFVFWLLLEFNWWSCFFLYDWYLYCLVDQFFANNFCFLTFNLCSSVYWLSYLIIGITSFKKVVFEDVCSLFDLCCFDVYLSGLCFDVCFLIRSFEFRKNLVFWFEEELGLFMFEEDWYLMIEKVSSFEV